MNDLLRNFLDPTKRKVLYGALLAIGTIIVTLGVLPQFEPAHWAEVGVQVIGIVAILVAGIKTKRMDYKGIYAGFAALVTALTTAGALNDGQSSRIYDLLAQAAVVAAMYQAFVRTDTQVPTGQPASEVVVETYVAEHGAGLEAPPAAEPNVGGYGGLP